MKACAQQGTGRCLNNEDLVNRYIWTSWGLSGCRPVDIVTIVILPHSFHAEIDNNVWGLGLPNSVVTFGNVPTAHRQESNLILPHQVYELGEWLPVLYRRLLREQIVSISRRSTDHKSTYFFIRWLTSIQKNICEYSNQRRLVYERPWKKCTNKIAR